MKKVNVISDVQLKYTKTDLPTVKVISSDTAATVARETIPQDEIAHRECFGLLLLNRANKILHKCIVATGGLNGVLVDPRFVMQYAILGNAAGIILFHNHPSGEVKPSECDKGLTKKIKEICELLDITLLDHLIISGYSDAMPNYFSFADEGLI
ncbi:MAG: JAB domain-containing protein [Bacteroidia bacterium]